MLGNVGLISERWHRENGLYDRIPHGNPGEYKALCINLKTKGWPLEPYREQKGQSRKSPGCAESSSQMCNSDGKLLVNDKTSVA